MKSRNLNFLEPSGLLQAYNGTALTLPFILRYFIITEDATEEPSVCVVDLMQLFDFSAIICILIVLFKKNSDIGHRSEGNRLVQDYSR